MSKCKAWSAIVALYLLCIAGLGVYILRLRADVMNIMITLDNPGFNRYCQRPDLSVFDRSVCLGSAAVAPHSAAAQSDDDKHDRLFMVYNDGSPYAFYKQWAEDEKWAGRVMAIPTKAVGPLASGPVFRSTIVGKLDGDFMSDMSQVDNLFAQIYQVAGIQLGLQIQFYYPVWKALRENSFARFQPIVEAHDEGFNTFCAEGNYRPYLQEVFDDIQCKDMWDCAYASIEQAAADSRRMKEKLFKELESNPKTAQVVHKCLDQEIGQTGGLFMYMASADHHAHGNTMLSRRVAKAHAIYVSNVEFTAEYLLKKYPDCLIAVYSDHGHAENIAIAEWADHGFEHDDNRGFLFLFSEKFRNKKLRAQGQIEPNINVFAHIAMLMRGANLPLLTENIPTSLYENDSVDRLRLLRAKEMQLESLLFDHKTKQASKHVGGYLQTQNIPSDTTIADLAANLGASRLQSLTKNYETHLEKVKADHFKQRLDDLLGNGFGKYHADLLVLLLAVGILVLAYKLSAGCLHNNQRMPLVFAVALLLLWHAVHCCFVAKFNMADVALVGVVLGLLGGLFWAMEHNLIILPFAYSAEAPDSSLLSKETCSSLKVGCLLLGLASPIVQMLFSAVLSRPGLVRLWLYSLSGTASVIGILLITFWTLVIIGWAWKGSLETQEDAADGTSTHTVSKYLLLWNKSTKILSLGYRLFQTFLVFRILYLLIKYEQKLFRQQNQDHGDEGVEIVQSIYWCVGVSMLSIFAGKPEFSKLTLVAVIFVNMSFWLNHLSRITLAAVVVPVLLYCLYKASQLQAKQQHASVSRLAWVALLLISQFALFQANGEGYTVYVNQRALGRQPTHRPDDEPLWEVPHIMNIKTCTALLVMSVFSAVQDEDTLLQTSLLVLFHVGFLMIECFFQVKAGVYWTSFYPMIAVHALIPVIFQLLAGAANLTQSLIARIALFPMEYSKGVEDAKTRMELSDLDIDSKGDTSA